MALMSFICKVETFAYCSVHIFDKVNFFYFHCDVYFLLPDGKIPYEIFTK